MGRLIRPRSVFVEHFVLDYARHPELPGERPARGSLLRARLANLVAQARSGPQPWGAETAEAWRRRTAAQVLFGVARTSSAARQVLRVVLSEQRAPELLSVRARRSFHRF
jgi:hypothetical protein